MRVYRRHKLDGKKGVAKSLKVEVLSLQCITVLRLSSLVLRHNFFLLQFFMSRQSIFLSRHCFSVSSLISLFICHDRVLNVVTKFFSHLPYSLSRQSYQVSRHSSYLPSSVLLRYSFPCRDNISKSETFKA